MKQRLLIVIVTTRHNQAVGAGCDFQIREELGNTAHQQFFCSGKTIRINVLLPIIDNPDIKLLIGR